MAGKILALVGNVSFEDVQEKFDKKFDTWAVRRGDPRGSGRKAAGKRDRRRDWFILASASGADLERAAVLLSAEGYAKNVDVYIADCPLGRRVAVPFFALPNGLKVSAERDSTGSVLVRARSKSANIDIGEFLQSLLQLPSGRSAAVRTVAGDAAFAPLLGMGSKSAVGEDAVPTGADSVPAYDLLLRASAAAGPVEPTPNVGAVVELEADKLPPVVNPAWVSPIGFSAEPASAEATISLTVHAGVAVAEVRAAGELCSVQKVDALVNEVIIHAVRPFRTVSVIGVAPEGVVLRLLANLLAAGVPVVGVPGPYRERLKAWPVLEQVLAEAAETDMSDDLRRYLWSVRARRAVRALCDLDTLRCEISARAGIPVSRNPSISVIVSSKRPYLLGRLLDQIFGQTVLPHEVLIAVHGADTPDVSEHLDEHRKKGNLQGVDVRIVHEPGTVPLGAVLRRLSDTATGQYLAKMDDDDFYGPHHLGDSLDAMTYSGADLVGAKAEFIYLEGQGRTIQRRPRNEAFNLSVTGGTLLLKRQAYEAAGGWPATGTAEDRLLVENLRRIGGCVYRIHGLNYIMSRGDGDREHTWNPGGDFFEDQAIRSWAGFGYPGWEGTRYGS